MRISRIVPVVLLCTAAAAGASQALAAAPASSTAHAAAAATVSLHSSPYGKILVNSKGDTLYLWAKDKKNKSACSGACLSVWPFVLVKGKPTAGPGVNASLLGTIKAKGGNEVTYNGSPLYTFVSDTKPGVISGEGNTTFGGPWWVVSAAGKAITKK
jgi:predicted lipoprotein with Yx(FWY)xxD motif